MPTYSPPSLTVDDATIDEMRAVAAAFGSIESTLAELGQRLYRVSHSLCDQVEGHDASDDQFADFLNECGHSDMTQAAMDAVAHVTFAVNGVPAYSPEWLIVAEAEHRDDEGV
jgi:hypothetical protein